MQVTQQLIQATLNGLGLLEGLIQLKKNFNLELGKNLSPRFWYQNKQHLKSYLARHEQTSENDAGKWVLYITPATLEPEFSLLSLLPQELVGERGKERVPTEEVEKYHQQLREFLEIINLYLVFRLAKVWTRFASLTSSMPKNFFQQNPLWQIYQDKQWDNQYFGFCKDIVLGLPVRCTGRGIDKAFLEWGVRSLIERMVLPLERRHFTSQVNYNLLRRTALSPSIQFRLQQGRLGQSYLGESSPDPWRALAIEVATPSWEIYSLFHPQSQAFAFVSEVIDFWLSPQKIEHEISFHYTGKRTRFAWPLGGKKRQGFGLLGHSTFLCRDEELPSQERCHQCFDTQLLTENYAYDRL